tara:strand:+ start:623 stop:943 length:321 start_codon:yes stop_codon:yes gene_type:complete
MPWFNICSINVDMSNIYQHFTNDLPTDSLILDAGCGSGRDSKAFLDMGYQVEAFDASSEMVKRASKYTDLDVKYAVFEMLLPLISMMLYGAVLRCYTYQKMIYLVL